MGPALRVQPLRPLSHRMQQMMHAVTSEQQRRGAQRKRPHDKRVHDCRVRVLEFDESPNYFGGGHLPPPGVATGGFAVSSARCDRHLRSGSQRRWATNEPARANLRTAGHLRGCPLARWPRPRDHQRQRLQLLRRQCLVSGGKREYATEWDGGTPGGDSGCGAGGSGGRCNGGGRVAAAVAPAKRLVELWRAA